MKCVVSMAIPSSPLCQIVSEEDLSPLVSTYRVPRSQRRRRERNSRSTRWKGVRVVGNTEVKKQRIHPLPPKTGLRLDRKKFSLC